MSTALEIRKQAAVAYRNTVERAAEEHLRTMLGTEQGREAAGRVALAFRQAASAAPELYAAEPGTVANAIALCALTGLMPGGPLPDCYLIPRRAKGVQGVQWMISARGMRTLAERKGWRVEAVPVFRGDTFRAPRGMAATVEHDPDYDAEQTWDTLRLVYVIARHPQMAPVFDVLTRKRIEERRAKSDSYRRHSGPWIDWPLEMAMKTAIKYAISRGLVPMDDVGARAYAADNEADVIDSVQVVQPVALAPAPQIAEAPTRGMDGLRAHAAERAAQRAAPEPAAPPRQEAPSAPEPTQEDSKPPAEPEPQSAAPEPEPAPRVPSKDAADLYEALAAAGFRGRVKASNVRDLYRTLAGLKKGERIGIKHWRAVYAALVRDWKCEIHENSGDVLMPSGLDESPTETAARHEEFAERQEATRLLAEVRTKVDAATYYKHWNEIVGDGIQAPDATVEQINEVAKRLGEEW